MNINDLTDLKKGSSDIQKVYKGSNMIWERHTPDIWEDLLHYYTFDNTNKDEIVNKNLPLYDTEYTTGKSGSGVKFLIDGSRGTLSSFSDYTFKRQIFTFNLWFNPGQKDPSTSLSNRVILHQPNYDGGGLDIILSVVSGDLLRLYFLNNIMTSSAINENTWYMISWTKTDTHLRFYLNAQLVGTQTIGNIPYSLAVSLIGKNHRLSSGGGFGHTIDELSYFSAPLSSDQITELYNGGNGKFYGDIPFPTDGLQHYWSFDNQSNLITYDSFSDANGTATITDVYGQTGKNNLGATFNSSINAYIEIPNRATLNKTGSFSISCWINLTELPNPTYGGCILHKGTFPYNYRIWSFDMSGNADLEFAMGLSSQFRSLRASNIALNTWYHFVGVYDSANGMRLYINGALNNSNTWTGELSQYTNNSLVFGRLQNGGATYLSKCKFDEVAIWGKVLSLADVQELYNGGTGLFYS